ncbi:hypothetical protein FSARC_6928 [Fusarium sarcochroum]|uniref:Peptidase M20 dimerisation domain-containing protein n=1 Tax=Fusarium sarcochroum TaxID=1208366 RepID=A0A8H4TWG9_9HYPO|nr:hypothetical protein FSARC_6928 [Fusarium sarcochroum]
MSVALPEMSHVEDFTVAHSTSPSSPASSARSDSGSDHDATDSFGEDDLTDTHQPAGKPWQAHSCRVDGRPKAGLTIDGTRLWTEIHHTAQWGAIPNSTGMARLALSDEDKLVRDYFVNEASDLGCKVSIDQMGNIFAVLPGHNNSIPPIGMGSHLDTQPAGGRYYGILGVLGALEVLRTIKASGHKTYAPLAAINWTNEHANKTREGARFTPGCSGSAVWASHMPLSKFHDLYDTTGTCTMEQELKRIGYRGSVQASYDASKLSAHIELHIEQRRLLQDAKKNVGVVTAIQGIRWYRVTVVGQRAHAGATPMAQRADALVAAAEMILFATARARDVSAVATIGVLELDRPSSNTVPGRATFTLDLRHPSESVLNDFESALHVRMKQLTVLNDRIQTSIERIWHSPAVQLDDEVLTCIRSAANSVVGQDGFMDTISLAGHDSALTVLRVPTAMIFVPSKDGVSHAPEEFTSEEECRIGVQVLLETVLEYDSMLRSRHES